MKEKLFALFVLMLTFTTMSAKWEDKTIEDLNAAISWNNTSAIRKIIEFHPEYLNEQYQIFWHRYTPLVKAITDRNYASAKLLLELGADPNIAASDRRLPLYAAIVQLNRNHSSDKENKYIRLLAQYGTDLNASSPEGESLLKLAASYNFEKLKCLVEQGADIEHCDIDGETVAIFALAYCPIETAHYLIVGKKADVTHPYYHHIASSNSNEIDYSVKHYAAELLPSENLRPDSKAYRQIQEIVEEFRRQGVDSLEWKDLSAENTVSETGEIAEKWENKTIEDLHEAITHNKTTAIRKIIEHHPEYLNYIGSQKYDNPLIRAIAYRHFAAAEELLRLGADPNIHSRDFCTPLIAAIQGHPNRIFHKNDSSTKCIKLLAEYGANLNDTCQAFAVLKSELVMSASVNMLMIACNRSQLEKLKCLVDLGGNIEQAGADGITAAIHALQYKQMECAHYLIVEKKANVTHPYYRRTPDSYPEIDFTKKNYAVDLLHNMNFDPNSKEYKLLQDIVEEFKRQGVELSSRRLFST